MTISAESPAVENHLKLIQDIISRVATNSANCKTWSMTLVSAIVVVVLERSRPDLLVSALLPVLLFFFLDSYYLSVERRLRAGFNDFVRKLHEDRLELQDLFVFQSEIGLRTRLKGIAVSALSLAVWPFYTLLVGLLYLVSRRLGG